MMPAVVGRLVSNALFENSSSGQNYWRSTHPSGTVWLTGDVAALTGGGGMLSFSRPGLIGRGPDGGLVARGLCAGGGTAPPPGRTTAGVFG